MSISQHRLAAHHEAGHCVTGLLFGRDLLRVSIRESGGRTEFRPMVCRGEANRSKLIVSAMSGRAAEVVLTGRPSKKFTTDDLAVRAYRVAQANPDIADGRALKRLARRGQGRSWAFAGDIPAVASYFRDLDEEQFLRAIPICWKGTLDIVGRRDVWAGIRAVAGELLRHGKLSGEAVRALLG